MLGHSGVSPLTFFCGSGVRAEGAWHPPAPTWVPRRGCSPRLGFLCFSSNEEDFDLQVNYACSRLQDQLHRQVPVRRNRLALRGTCPMCFQPVTKSMVHVDVVLDVLKLFSRFCAFLGRTHRRIISISSFPSTVLSTSSVLVLCCSIVRRNTKGSFYFPQEFMDSNNVGTFNVATIDVANRTAFRDARRPLCWTLATTCHSTFNVPAMYVAQLTAFVQFAA